MFTIKQVTRTTTAGSDEPMRNDDKVRLFEARNPYLETGLEGRQQVAFTMDDGCHCTIDSGVVFVMNDAGQTVDTFRLANSDWF